MSSAETLLGHIIGDYQLTRILGKGGTSAVFLGEKVTSPQELVAIKVLLPPSSCPTNELIECRQRFVREILTLQERLHHPSILPILASGEDPFTKYAYMIVPYISGGSLAKHIVSGGLSLSKISHYVTQIAEALDYAHSQQVIHRDLKPANILVDESDHVYLVDFGIAKLFNSALDPISEPGLAVGTPGYMAPEQARGAPVSNATDIYGLAVLTYTLVTGRLPFPPTSVGQMLLQVATMPPIPPRTFRSDLPESAEAVLLRALSKEPADRFPTACEFATALAENIESFWPQAFYSQMSLPKPRSGPALVSRRTTLMGLAGLSLVGSGALWYHLAAASSLRPILLVLPPNKLKIVSIPPKPGVGLPTNSTSTPDVQPTSSHPGHQIPPNTTPSPVSPATTPSPVSSTPGPNPTPVPPLSVTITNIPSEVLSGSTVSVGVTASQPDASVMLHITYSGVAKTYDLSPQVSDSGGLSTFSWSVLRFSSLLDLLRLSTITATVMATASNTRGENVQSPSVQVQVIPSDAGDD